MITFFTDPHNEESLSGVFSRYHFYSGNYKKEDTLEELMGNRDTLTVKIFPSRLNYLENELNNKNYTADYFIYRHTIFPIYSPFASKETQNKVIRHMKISGSDKIYIIFSMTKSKLRKISNYRYCPICAREDFEKYKEAYFHRLHQFEGILICEKHKCQLKGYPIKYNEEESFVYFDYNIVKDEEITFYSENITKILDTVSNSIVDIINLPYLKYSREIIMEKYKDILSDKGYTTPKGYIKSLKLINDFKEYYGIEVLELLDAEVNELEKENWMRVIFHNRNYFIHPIKNILLIIFLAGDVKSFFKYEKKVQIFGQGPWPCLNPVCVNYKKRVIKKYTTQQAYKSRLLNGIFKCELCGYTYRRKSDNVHGEEIYRKDKVLDYGEVWKNEFYKLVEENEGIYYIVRRMGVKYEFVKYYLDNRMFKPKPKFSVEKKKDNFREYSNDVIKYISNNPNCLRSSVKINMPKQYAWLKYNNKEWLKNVLPKPQKRTGYVKKYNLEEKDKYILEKIRIAYEEIMNERPAVRIRFLTIERKIKIKIKSKISELPKSKEYISKILESIHQFRVRRLNIYLRNEENSKIKKTKSRILRDNSIYLHKLTIDEKEEIEKIIAEHIN